MLLSCIGSAVVCEPPVQTPCSTAALPQSVLPSRPPGPPSPGLALSGLFGGLAGPPLFCVFFPLFLLVSRSFGFSTFLELMWVTMLAQDRSNNSWQKAISCLFQSRSFEKLARHSYCFAEASAKPNQHIGRGSGADSFRSFGPRWKT